MFGFILLGVLYLISTPFFVRFFIGTWEKQSRPLELSSLSANQNYNIVVLGGGSDFNPGYTPWQQLGVASKDRIMEAWRVAKYLPNSRIITSGYSKIGKSPCALIMKQSLQDFGLKNSISMMIYTTNTEEEAKTYAKIFDKKQPIILITNAYHMPRAIKWFHENGITTIVPAPSSFLNRSNYRLSLGKFIPNFDTAAKFQLIAKEYIGLIECNFRLWVTSLSN